jgi:subfamily B ATP-binding cassette protein MsbA
MVMGQVWSQLSLVKTLGTVWPFVRPDLRSLVGATVAASLLTAVEISIPLMSRLYVDSITGVVHGYENVLLLGGQDGLIALLLGAGLARGVLLTWQRSVTGVIGERTAGRLRSGLWSHLQDLPIEKTQRRGSGRLLVRFVSDIRSVQRLVTDVLIQGAQDLAFTVVVLLILVILNWWMALPALLLMPAYATIFWLMNPALRRHSRAARRRRTRLSAYLNERIVGMKMVKAHVRERAEAAHVSRMTRALAARGGRLASTAAWMQGATAAVATCSIALTLALAPGEIAAGRATGGTLVAFLMLLLHLAPKLRRLAQLNRSVQEAHVSLSRLKGTLDQRVEVGVDPATRRLRISHGRVSFKRVSFVSDDGVRVINRVSLHASRGELVAVVGPTGAGKSTLLDLLLRFKEPTSGRIVIDGRRIENVSLSSLRAQIGWVPQEAVLFDGTLRENVTYGSRRRPSADRIDRAIRGAGLDDVVRRLPDGLDTRVGGAGQMLSHGERQHVALARALIADPPILVVDELSSAADAEAGQSLAVTLRALSREKTVIVSTRQASVLVVADRIYVLVRGRQVEQGTHTELLHRGTAYPGLIGAAPAPEPASTSQSTDQSAHSESTFAAR